MFFFPFLFLNVGCRTRNKICNRQITKKQVILQRVLLLPYSWILFNVYKFRKWWFYHLLSHSHTLFSLWYGWRCFVASLRLLHIKRTIIYKGNPSRNMLFVLKFTKLEIPKKGYRNKNLQIKVLLMWSNLSPTTKHLHHIITIMDQELLGHSSNQKGITRNSKGTILGDTSSLHHALPRDLVLIAA